MIFDTEDQMENGFGPRDFIFDGYELIGGPVTPIAIPLGHSTKYKRYLTAAATTYSFGNKSIDNIYKRFSHLWYNDDLENEKKEPVNLLFDINNKAMIFQRKISTRLNGLRDMPDIPGLVIAGAAQIKLGKSFQSARFLLSKGLYNEACAVLKLILEQIAWIYKIYEIEEEDFQKFKPSKCINHLNKVIPRTGKLYGYINEGAHIDPSEVYKYFIIKNGIPQVVTSSIVRCLDGAVLLLYVTDIYGIIMEKIYKNYLTEFEFIGNKGEILENRTSEKEIEYYLTRIEAVKEKFKLESDLTK